MRALLFMGGEKEFPERGQWVLRTEKTKSQAETGVGLNR